MPDSFFTVAFRYMHLSMHVYQYSQQTIRKTWNSLKCSFPIYIFFNLKPCKKRNIYSELSRAL